MKTIDLFIRTYAGDAQWLPYCLKSINKYCSGFSNLIVVTPQSSEDVIKPIASEYGANFFICNQLNRDDYVGQQGTKMMADTWCTSDAICYVDSDALFTTNTTPTDIIIDGRINLLKTPYSSIECPWQKFTEDVIGFPVEFEYMRRLPLTYNKDLLEVTRCHIETVHNKPFIQFISDIEGRNFSEFNILGAMADKFSHNNFNWIDTTTMSLPDLYVKQFWSWGGISDEILNQIETILA